MERDQMGNKMRLNFWLDVVLAVILILLQFPSVTGNELHQMTGIVLGVGVIVHLILHRKWIVATCKSVFKPLPSAVRMNLLLNILLLIFFALTCVSGLLNSPTQPSASASPAITNGDPNAAKTVPNDAQSERQGRLVSRRTSLDSRAGPVRGDFLWHMLHNLSARLTLLIVIVHLVLHRKWIANAMKQTAPRPLAVAIGEK
jgi:hypothetical protein